MADFERLVVVIGRLEAMIQNNQEKTETYQESAMVELDAHHERMMARMDSQLETTEVAVYIVEERMNKLDTTDL
jgi:hypothetical protein